VQQVSLGYAAVAPDTLPLLISSCASARNQRWQRLNALLKVSCYRRRRILRRWRIYALRKLLLPQVPQSAAAVSMTWL
jgi:hypothetical protein